MQHALRAYTPAERKAVKAAAESFRENDQFDTEEVITDLGVGEALVSTLDRKGVPTVVARTLIRPPSSRLGPATDAEREVVKSDSPVGGQYDEAIDRESAYEILLEREEEAAEAAEREAERLEKEKERERKEKERTTTRRRRSTRQSPGEAALKSGLRTLANEVTRYLVRGVLGGRRR